MFRKRAIEILRRGFKSINKLDTTEGAERLTVERPPVVEDTLLLTESSELGSFRIIDPAVIEALSIDFDLANPF